MVPKWLSELSALSLFSSPHFLPGKHLVRSGKHPRLELIEDATWTLTYSYRIPDIRNASQVFLSAKQELRPKWGAIRASEENRDKPCVVYL